MASTAEKYDAKVKYACTKAGELFVKQYNDQKGYGDDDDSDGTGVRSGARAKWRPISGWNHAMEQALIMIGKGANPSETLGVWLIQFSGIINKEKKQLKYTQAKMRERENRPNGKESKQYMKLEDREEELESLIAAKEDTYEIHTDILNNMGACIERLLELGYVQVVSD